MLQKLPADGSKRKKKKFRFAKKFIQNFDDDNNKGYIREVDGSCPKHLRKIHNNLYFMSDRIKLKKVKYLRAICMAIKSVYTQTPQRWPWIMGRY